MKNFNAVFSAALQREKKFPSATRLQMRIRPDSCLQRGCKREYDRKHVCNAVAKKNLNRFAFATRLQRRTGTDSCLQRGCREEPEQIHVCNAVAGKFFDADRSSTLSGHSGATRPVSVEDLTVSFVNFFQNATRLQGCFFDADRSSTLSGHSGAARPVSVEDLTVSRVIFHKQYFKHINQKLKI